MLALKAFFGCFAVVQGGKIYHAATLHAQRYIVDLLSGLVAESLIKHGNNLSESLIVKVNLIGEEDLLTARLPQLSRFRDIGGEQVGNTKRGKGTKLMALADGRGLPIGITTASANKAEVNLTEPLIDSDVTGYVPGKLIYDKAADSDSLRDRLSQRDIDLITPHRKNRVYNNKQDGRKLRRYARRWKIERTISWLHDFRRLVVRYEFYWSPYQGFARIAALIMAIKRF